MTRDELIRQLYAFDGPHTIKFKDSSIKFVANIWDPLKCDYDRILMEPQFTCENGEITIHLYRQ